MGQLVPVVEGLPPLQTYTDPAIVAGTGGQPGEVSEPRSATGIALFAVGGVVVLVVLIAILLVDLDLTCRCVAAAAGVGRLEPAGHATAAAASAQPHLARAC